MSGRQSFVWIENRSGLLSGWNMLILFSVIHKVLFFVLPWNLKIAWKIEVDGSLQVGQSYSTFVNNENEVKHSAIMYIGIYIPRNTDCSGTFKIIIAVHNACGPKFKNLCLSHKKKDNFIYCKKINMNSINTRYLKV